MIDLDELLAPLVEDAPAPKPFQEVRDRAALLRKRRRARRRLAAVATTLTIGTFAIIGLSVIQEGRHHSTTVTVIGPRPTTIVPLVHVGPPRTFPVPGVDMLAAFGSIWVSQPDQVSRLDAQTGRVLATIPVPGTADNRALAAGAGSVWVDDTGTQTITRIDPRNDAVLKNLRLPSAPLVVDGLAFTDGKLWVARPQPLNDNQGDIVAIDPSTYQIVIRAPVPRTFAVDSGGSHVLWFLRAENPLGRGSDLLRFDTRSLGLTVVRQHTLAILAATPDQLWVQTPDHEVIQVDPNTGAQVGPAIPVADTVNLSATVASDIIWIGAQPDSSMAGHVAPYDVATGRTLAPSVAVGLPIAAMATIDGSLWVDAGGLTLIPYSQP